MWNMDLCQLVTDERILLEGVLRAFIVSDTISMVVQYVLPTQETINKLLRDKMQHVLCFIDWYFCKWPKGWTLGDFLDFVALQFDGLFLPGSERKWDRWKFEIVDVNEKKVYLCVEVPDLQSWVYVLRLEKLHFWLAKPDENADDVVTLDRESDVVAQTFALGLRQLETLKRRFSDYNLSNITLKQLSESFFSH